MATPAVELIALQKRYGQGAGQVRALAGVDLTIGQGEFFALLGPNGAGKTTLINVLGGLVKATSGQARVMGFDVQRDYVAARRHLGVVPQELVFDPFFTVREALRFQSGYFGLTHNDDWIEALIERLGLTDKADTNMRQLSGGMKRRVLVAQALVHKPPVIILDEPTAGVDVALRKSLWAFIRELNVAGHTILLTTHYLEEAEQLCSRVAMLRQGRIVALDTTANLMAGKASLEAAFVEIMAAA
jgi:ABC-2 type transport system ATP-binding protein